MALAGHSTVPHFLVRFTAVQRGLAARGRLTAGGEAGIPTVPADA